KNPTLPPRKSRRPGPLARNRAFEWAFKPSGSSRANVLRLQTLRAAGHVELHLHPFRKGTEPLHLDGGVMAEHILATTVLGKEPKALRVVEPFHGTSCHCFFFPR